MSTVNSQLKVEGFDPERFVQHYADGKRYLPLDVQIAWFRRVYPTGRIDAGEPQPDPMREPDTFICTAKIYASIGNAAESFLALASARRSKTEEIEQQSLDNPYTAVQSIAISRALKLAGFWCEPSAEDYQPKESPAPVVSTQDAPKATDSSVAKKEKEVPAEEKKTQPSKEAVAEKISDNNEMPVKTERQKRARKEKTEPQKEQKSANEAVTEKKEEPVKENVSEESRKPVAKEEPAKKEDSIKENVPKKETAAKAASIEVKNEKDTVAAPVPEKQATEETASDKKEAVNAEAPVAEKAPVEKDAVVVEESKDVKVANKKEDASASSLELEKAWEVPVKVAYFDGKNMRELYDRCNQETPDMDCISLFWWLRHSGLAPKVNAVQHEAALIIQEQAHQDWMDINPEA